MTKPKPPKPTCPTAKRVQQELVKHQNPEKAVFFPRFFRTGPGEYGEGDQFIGVVVPDQRKVARQFSDLEMQEVEKLLDSPLHECRLTGLLILEIQFKAASSKSRRKILYDFYVRNVDRVNNWDLVDAAGTRQT